MTAYIYCRVSSVRQRENGVSLDAQEDSLKKYCKKQGWDVKATVKECASAKTTQKQVLLKQLTNTISEPCYLVVYSVSRFSRNLTQGLNLANKLAEKGIMLQSATEKIDITTKPGKYNLTTLLNAAEVESKNTSDRVKQGLNYKKSLGNQFGKPLYGKKVIVENGVRKFARNEHEFYVLRFVRHLRYKGTTLKILNLMLEQLAPEEPPLEFNDRARTVKQPMTWKNIAQILNDYHIPARNIKLWTHSALSSLRKLLRDPDLCNYADLYQDKPISKSPTKFKETPANTPLKDQENQTSDSDYDNTDDESDSNEDSHTICSDH